MCGGFTLCTVEANTALQSNYSPVKTNLKHYPSELWWEEEENTRLSFRNGWKTKGEVVKGVAKGFRFFNMSWFSRVALQRLFFVYMRALKPTVLKLCSVVWALQLDRFRFESLLGYLLTVPIGASYWNSLNFTALIIRWEDSHFMLIRGFCEELIIQ